MDWARNRSQLWNAAEWAETASTPAWLESISWPFRRARCGSASRTGSRLLELPRGIDLPSTWPSHAPRDFPGSDPRNFHAHLLATTREINCSRLTAKTSLESTMRSGIAWAWARHPRTPVYTRTLGNRKRTSAARCAHQYTSRSPHSRGARNRSRAVPIHPACSVRDGTARV